MFDLTHGFLFFLIGCTVTIVGFFLAYLVATRHLRVEKKELTDQLELYEFSGPSGKIQEIEDKLYEVNDTIKKLYA